MKKIILLLLICFVSVTSAFAYDTEVDGFYYNINLATKTAAITHGEKKYYGDVVIPTSMNFRNRTFPVTKIDEEAFSECYDLRSVVIPDIIDTIGYRAFYECTNLAKVKINKGVLLGGSFRDCHNLQEVTLGNDVTFIGGSSFLDCWNLRTINIGNKITRILSYTFNNCKNLTKLIIPNTVKEIDKYAFTYCNNLYLVFKEGFDCTMEDQGDFLPKYLYLSGTIHMEYGDLPWNGRDLKGITFGKDYKGIKMNTQLREDIYYRSDSLLTVTSLITDPTQFTPEFSHNTYVNGTLYVPKGTKSLYENAKGWKDFFEIQEKDFTTGIENASINSNCERKEIYRYDVLGNRLTSPRKGINIIKYSNGDVEKVLVK